MHLENILSTFPLEIRESPAMKGLVVLIQTLQEQLQKTQEQLTKAEAKIQVLEEELSRLRKTPKRPKFRPNGMQPRNRNNSLPPSSGPEQPLANASLVHKEVSEVKIKLANPPTGSRFKGYQSFSIQEVSLIAKEITYKLEVWQTPDGDVIRAELLKEIKGSHYGPILWALASNLYAQGMTQPAIHEFLFEDWASTYPQDK